MHQRGSGLLLSAAEHPNCRGGSPFHYPTDLLSNVTSSGDLQAILRSNTANGVSPKKKSPTGRRTMVNKLISAPEESIVCRVVSETLFLR